MTPNKCLYEVKFTLRYKFNEHTPYGISIYKLSPQKANTTTVQCYIEQHYELRFSQVQRHYEEIICYSDSPRILFDFSKDFFQKKPSLTLTNTIKIISKYEAHFIYAFIRCHVLKDIVNFLGLYSVGLPIKVVTNLLDILRYLFNYLIPFMNYCRIEQ